MRKLSLAAFSLLVIGAVVSGGSALGATILAVDADGNLTNGVNNTATLGAGTHTVIVAITELDASAGGTLGAYTLSLDISNTAVLAGNPITARNLVDPDPSDPDIGWSQVSSLRDVNASDGRVRLSYLTLDPGLEVNVAVPFPLASFQFTVGTNGSVTVSIPTGPNITQIGNVAVPFIPITSTVPANIIGGVLPLIFPYFPNFDIVNDIEMYNETDSAPLAIYLLDGWGAAHKITGQSSTAPWFNPAYYPGKDWICDLELLDANEAGGAGNESCYMLDRFGAVHSDPSAEFGNQVYFFDQSGLASVATDFEPYVVNNQVLGGWVLDEFGNVWAVGAAPGAGGQAIISLNLPGRSTDAEIDSEGAVNDLYAVDFAVVGNGAGVVVMDSFGILHSSGSASQLGPNLMFGYNIARDLWVNAAGDGAIVLDGFGAIHALGNVDTAGVDAILASSPYFPNLDIARDLEIFQGASDTITGAYILDGYGAIHRTGGAQYPDAN